jgi:hypothetical protein
VGAVARHVAGPGPGGADTNRASTPGVPGPAGNGGTPLPRGGVAGPYAPTREGARALVERVVGNHDPPRRVAGATPRRPIPDPVARRGLPGPGREVPDQLSTARCRRDPGVAHRRLRLGRVACALSGLRAPTPLLQFGKLTCPPSSPRPHVAWILPCLPRCRLRRWQFQRLGELHRLLPRGAGWQPQRC